MQIKQRLVPPLNGQLQNFPPFLQRIYLSRGIEDESKLNKALQALLPFNTLTDIDKACVRLEQALDRQERVLIIGDFDADGATSTALAVSALKVFGLGQIEFLVPNRFDFGYGLTPAIVEVATKWKPNLIITVDNGIASLDGVNAANQAGIDVLVTDHHLPGEELPKACAIVNPNQPNDSFESKSIAGVGVIFYLMLALRRHLSNINWFQKNNREEPNMAQFLDLVALGTVADVVALDQNNRILVNQGLLRIRQGACRPGIKALLEIANKDLTRIRETDLGFSVAPRLNAAGRLDDMSLGIECLLSEDINKAKKLATQLDELNVERRLIEAEMKEKALMTIDKLTKKLEADSNQLPIALCLVDKTWHQGVIGILAGRLKERYHRPVIVFAVVNETEIKGSARSVPGLNIRDVLASIDKDHPGLLTKFGGHAMAAGLTLNLASFEHFQQALIREVAKHLHISQCEGEIMTDGPLGLAELNLETARLIQHAGPWGQEFPEPLFDNIFTILEQRLVGQRHLKLSLLHPEGGDVIDAIAFNIDLKLWPNHRAKQAHIAYRLDINTFQNRTRLQLMVEGLNAL